MTDTNAIAANYIAAWNETDAGRRKTIIAKTFAADTTYTDPLMKGDGHDGVDALIAGVHARFPGFRFALIGKPDGHGDHVRFSWGLGPEGGEQIIKGTDFADLEQGRLKRVTGFLDQVPAAA